MSWRAIPTNQVSLPSALALESWPCWLGPQERPQVGADFSFLGWPCEFSAKVMFALPKTDFSELAAAYPSGM